MQQFKRTTSLCS